MCSPMARGYDNQDNYPPRTIDLRDITTCHRCSVQLHVTNTRPDGNDRICTNNTNCDKRFVLRQ